MIIWKNVIKNTLKSFIPLLPAFIVVFAAFLSFGVSTNFLLVVSITVQFYIVWAQLEVALKQTRIHELGYEPVFLIKVEKEVVSAMNSRSTIHVVLKIKNEGKYPAFNVLITVMENSNVVEHKMESTIPPNNEIYVCSLEENIFKTKRIHVYVLYNNIIGDHKEVWFIKNLGESFMVLRSPLKKPGILLSSLEDLFETMRLIYLFKIRKPKLPSIER